MTKPEPQVDFGRALEQMQVPAYAVDRELRLVWMNRRHQTVFGLPLGERVVRAVAPEDLHLARMSLAKKLIGEVTSTEFNLTLLDKNGDRFRARITSVPLVQDGEIVGVFGLAYPHVAFTDGVEQRPRPASAPELTARQHQALLLLAEGLGTADVAERLGVAEETARNHIRGVLRQLDVHSRLEAVVRADQLGLLPPRD